MLREVGGEHVDKKITFRITEVQCLYFALLCKDGREGGEARLGKTSFQTFSAFYHWLASKWVRHHFSICDIEIHIDF